MPQCVSKFEWFRKNAPDFLGELRWDDPLSRHTYYRIGGSAPVVAVPKNEADLLWLAEGLRTTGLPSFILGAGTNLLVSDSGFYGLVIKLTRLNRDISPMQSGIHTGSGVLISALLRKATQEGWGGFEFLTGIPGSVGGAVVMNAGTHLGETKDHLIAVDVFSLQDCKKIRFDKKDFKFEYRKNLFLPEGSIITAAEWRIDPKDPADVKKAIDEILVRRKTTQPLDYPSCGSVFKNPVGMHAWQIIERLGLRGHRVGAAQFSEKHCNFIVNLGASRAEDVYALIQLAKKRAADELGIHLEEEVRYLGEM